MNEFFVSKIKKLRDGCNTSGIRLHPAASGSQPNSQDDILLLPSPEAVIRAINGLRRTGASEEGEMTAAVLQLAAPVIAMPVTHLISLSFVQATVSTAFKAAIVVPIHKGMGKPANLPPSYRPVAIFHTLF